MNANDKTWVALLRSRAAALLAAADALEGKGEFALRSSQAEPVILPDGLNESTMESVRAYIEQKKARPKDLSIFFNCPETTIRTIVETPGSGLAMNERGWIVADPANLDPLWDV